MNINVMFNKLLYLQLIITKRKNYLTYNKFYNNKCSYTISNVNRVVIKILKFV